MAKGSQLHDNQQGRRLKLIPDWKSVALKSWSSRLAVLSAGFAALEATLPNFNGVVPPKTFAIASALVGVLSAIARVVYQQSMHENEI